MSVPLKQHRAGADRRRGPGPAILAKKPGERHGWFWPPPVRRSGNSCAGNATGGTGVGFIALWTNGHGKGRIRRPGLLTVWSPASALRSLPSVALSSARARAAYHRNDGDMHEFVGSELNVKTVVRYKSALNSG
jgi:hypothetical protein